MRTLTVPIGARLPDAIRFHFADASWGWALGAALSAIWTDDGSGRRRPWFIGGALFAVAIEVAQAAHILPGTFDPLDVVVTVGAYLVGWLLASRAFARRKDQHV